MANTPTPKSSLITDVLAFVTDKKKLPLILLLLGGSATVVTTAAVVLSNPGSGAENSGPISGNEIPNLDFDDATLNPNGSGIGASFDFNYMSRYQNDYYLQAGRNFFEGATSQNDSHTEVAFAIYNVRAGDIEFEYTFDFGATHRAAIIAGTANNYYGDLRIAYDNESTVFVALEAYFPSTIGGSYDVMKSYATTKYGSVGNNDYYQFLLSFDINNPTTYTVLDSRKSNQSDFYMNDMLYENDQLYVSTSFRKSFLENSGSRNEDNVFEFMTIPTDIPNLTVVNGNNTPLIGYISQVSVEGTTLDVLSHTPFASNYNSNLWFSGYRQGFETRFFTEEGFMVLTANFWNNNFNENNLDITTFYDNLEATFLPEDTSSIDEAETNSLAAYDAVLDTPNSDNFDNISFNLNINGFFNFETEKFEHAYSGYNVYGYNYNNGQEQRAEAYNWPQLYLTDSGDTFIVDNKTVSTWEYDGNPRAWSQYNPDHLVSALSTLSRYNIETGEKTILLEHENNGTIVNGVYEKSNGYYITGSYYETDSNDAASVDAYLIATNDSFVTQQELVLSGSRDEMGQTIMLDGSGRPVWMVMSNSTDGDFAGLGGTENRFTTYSVSF